MNPALIITLVLVTGYFVAFVINLYGNLHSKPKLISKGVLTLDAVDGTETIINSNRNCFCLLRRYIRTYFGHLDEASIATPKMPIRVYQPRDKVTASEMFVNMSKDLDKLCFTQHQVINFAVKYSSIKWLWNDIDRIFFLVKQGEDFFVVSLSEYWPWISPNIEYFHPDHSQWKEQTFSDPSRIFIVVPKPLDKISKGFFFLNFVSIEQ